MESYTHSLIVILCVALFFVVFIVGYQGMIYVSPTPNITVNVTQLGFII